MRFKAFEHLTLLIAFKNLTEKYNVVRADTDDANDGVMAITVMTIIRLSMALVAITSADWR